MGSRKEQDDGEEVKRPPGAAECLLILSRHGVPEHIVEHSRKVAALALRLAEDLGGTSSVPPEIHLVEAAALLHDISKADCLGTCLDHAREGGRVLRSLGFSRLARLVELHIDPGGSNDGAEISEAEIVAYCDKRVLHDRVVSLEERYRYLLERYGKSCPDTRAKVLATWRRMESLESRIFRRLPYPPGELCTEGRRG